MTVSILIPLKSDVRYLTDCIQSCLNQNYQDFEIIVLPDSEINLKFPKTIIVPTGEITPPKKRDLGLKFSKGDIIAFLDDDTIVTENWLENAVNDFKDSDIAAVGGPAVTPSDDTLMQKASGEVYNSFLVSGNFSFRYRPMGKRTVDDYPSCNFILRRNIFESLGGFNNNFWPGEDTLLCLEITKKLGMKIVYDPKVLVYHHRRRLFLGHLKQIAGYALHRGYFVKKFPQTSFKLSYFIPSLLLFWLIFGSCLFRTQFSLLYLVSIFMYLFVCLIFSFRKDLRLTPLVFLGIILTHLVYGFYFIKGLISRRLRDELTPLEN